MGDATVDVIQLLRRAGTPTSGATRSNQQTWQTMVDMMGTGDSHVSTQHRLAVAMHQDGISLSGPLERFAACGAWGEAPQNVERDLHSWLQPKLALQLEPYVIQFLAANNDGEVEPCTCSIVAPHDYIRAAHRI